MRNKPLAALLTATLATCVAACGDESGPAAHQNQGGSDTTMTNTTNAQTMLGVSLEGLEPAGDGYLYEGWVIVDGAPITTGRFNVTADTSDYEFSIDADVAAAATTFVLTIEPAQGDDPAPSAVHVLAGEIADGQADLTVDHPAALGTDFSDAAGAYILATPTSGAVADDYDQGIWWLTPPMPFEASLSLPELPDGWVYEGWVVGPDGPISTGRFTDVMGSDSDGAGEHAGPDGGPAFPGQDFIDPALVLTDGHAAVISVEPEPDDSPAPFVLKPLVDMAIEDVGEGMPQAMTNNAVATDPTGRITLDN